MESEGQRRRARAPRAVALVVLFAASSLAGGPEPEAAAGAGSSCAPATFERDTQLKCTPGGNIVLHAQISTAAACCSLCAAHPGGGCVAWAWSMHAGAGSCNLKNGTQCEHIHHVGTTAGLLAPLPPAPPPPPPPPPSPPYVPPHTTPPGAHNVLFFAVDDMRPNIGAYNHSLAHTPTMDELAATGLTFHRAYVQYAYCSPSRHSFMTGRRPDTTRVWEFVDHFREVGVGADWISLPQYFKTFGYLTLGRYKVAHLLLHFMLKTILSPSQARDKHRENSKKRDVFLTAASSSIRRTHRRTLGSLRTTGRPAGAQSTPTLRTSPRTTHTPARMTSASSSR